MTIFFSSFIIFCFVEPIQSVEWEKERIENDRSLLFFTYFVIVCDLSNGISLLDDVVVVFVFSDFGTQIVLHYIVSNVCVCVFN